MALVTSPQCCCDGSPCEPFIGCNLGMADGLIIDSGTEGALSRNMAWTVPVVQLRIDPLMANGCESIGTEDPRYFDPYWVTPHLSDHDGYAMTLETGEEDPNAGDEWTYTRLRSPSDCTLVAKKMIHPVSGDEIIYIDSVSIDGWIFEAANPTGGDYSLIDPAAATTEIGAECPVLNIKKMLLRRLFDAESYEGSMLVEISGVTDFVVPPEGETETIECDCSNDDSFTLPVDTIWTSNGGGGLPGFPPIDGYHTAASYEQGDQDAPACSSGGSCLPDGYEEPETCATGANNRAFVTVMGGVDTSPVVSAGYRGTRINPVYATIGETYPVLCCYSQTQETGFNIGQGVYSTLGAVYNAMTPDMLIEEAEGWTVGISSGNCDYSGATLAVNES